MPHYRDGSEARVGDIVKGPTYNKPGICVGVVCVVTPGAETCNLQVEAFMRKIGDTIIGAGGADYGEARAFDKVL